MYQSMSLEYDYKLNDIGGKCLCYALSVTLQTIFGVISYPHCNRYRTLIKLPVDLPVELARSGIVMEKDRETLSVRKCFEPGGPRQPGGPQWAQRSLWLLPSAHSAYTTALLNYLRWLCSQQTLQPTKSHPVILRIERGK